MLWQCIIAGTKEHFEGHKHPQPPHKIHPQAWGVVTHPFKALARSARPHVGRLGAISAGGGHVVAVVMPVVFCVRLLKNAMKLLKLVFTNNYFINNYML
jgi:hypothetical protein